MKLQQEIQRQSRKTGQGIRSTSAVLYPSSCREWWEKKEEESEFSAKFKNLGYLWANCFFVSLSSSLFMSNGPDMMNPLVDSSITLVKMLTYDIRRNLSCLPRDILPFQQTSDWLNSPTSTMACNHRISSISLKKASSTSLLWAGSL